MPTLQAKEIKLSYLIQDFGLELIEDDQFFSEWQDNLPELSDFQQQQLDQVKAGYLNLQNYDAIAENIVKMTVLDPLLFIGEFYLNPFWVTAEEPIDLISQDEEIIVKGRIDTLILADRLWLMIIEAKRSTYSIEAGLPQILAYMMASPYPELPSYGMITTGSEFIFLKLVKNSIPKYATSNVFNLRNRGNDLYEVLKIMKKLSNTVLTK
jgi:hypothetical protein